MTPVTVVSLCSENSQKWPKMPLLLDNPMVITLQLQGSFTPLTRGSAPGPSWGLRSQTSIIGSPFSVAMCSLHRALDCIFTPPLVNHFSLRPCGWCPAAAAAVAAAADDDDNDGDDACQLKSSSVNGWSVHDAANISHVLLRSPSLPQTSVHDHRRFVVTR